VSVVILHQSLGSAGTPSPKHLHDMIGGHATLDPISALGRPCVHRGAGMMTDPYIVEDVGPFQKR